MKLLYLPLLAFLLIQPVLNGPVDTVAQLIGKGAVPELAKPFTAEIEIGLPGAEEETHPKAVAQTMLEKFFAQNKPTGGKLLHKITGAGSIEYGVVLLTTTKGHFRVSFNIKEDNGIIHLLKILIEPEKVK